MQKCDFCPKGTTLAESRDRCVPCPLGTLGQFGGICYKCPAFTYAEDNTCRVFDTLEHTLSKTKFQLGRLVQLQENSCNSGESNCSGDFIGPFKNSKEYLFFFNFAKTSKFKHNLFELDSYSTQISASIVKLFGYQNEKSFEHAKYVDILGNQLLEIQFVPSNYNKTGLIFKYLGENDCAGAICGSSIFFECSKEGDNLAPEVVYNNQVEYLFRWKTRFACPQCRNDQLNSFNSKCTNSETFLIFEEESNCAIFAEDFGLSHSENSGLIDETRSKWEMEVFDIRKVSHSAEPGEYITNYSETQFCFAAENLDSASKWMFWVVILTVLACFLICLGFFCKYRQLKSTYNRLLDRGNTVN